MVLMSKGRGLIVITKIISGEIILSRFLYLTCIKYWLPYISFFFVVISPLMDFILNTEFIMLMVGLCRLDSCFYTHAKSKSNWSHRTRTQEIFIHLSTMLIMYIVGASILSTDPGFVMTESSHLNNFVERPVSVFEAHSKVVNVESLRFPSI